MLDRSIVNETSPEANWNRQTGGQADAQDHVLSQAAALTKKKTFLAQILTKTKKISKSFLLKIFEKKWT